MIKNCNDTISKVKDSNYDVKLWKYHQSSDKSARYVLGTKGENTLLCFGVNPSTASPSDLDPTLKCVSRIAESNGYDSYIMCNLYPQRATEPNNMHKVMDESYVEENILAIRSIFNEIQEQKNQIDIWVAWGSIIDSRDYLINCLEQISEVSKEYNTNFICRGKISKSGHPHHPLYVAKTEQFKPFDMESYLR